LTAPAVRKKARDTDRLEEHSAESAAQGCTCPVGEITRVGIPSRCNTRLLFLFSPSFSLSLSLSLSHPPSSLPALPPRMRERGEGRPAQILPRLRHRGDSSSRDLRDSQPRSRRLRATSLGAKGAWEEDKEQEGEEKEKRTRREGRRGGREKIARRGRASGDDAPRPTNRGLLHRLAEFRGRN